MLSDMNDQFENYWKQLTRAEKKFLVTAEKSKDNQISSILKRKGFILIEEDTCKIFSSLFQKFVDKKARTDSDLVFD